MEPILQWLLGTTWSLELMVYESVSQSMSESVSSPRYRADADKRAMSQSVSQYSKI